MKESVKERIIKFIDAKNISTRSFENTCSLSNGYIRQLRNSPTADKIENIINAFPELNRDWLLTGVGEMLKNNQSVGNICNSNVSGVNVSGKEIHINPDAYNTLLKIVESNQKTTEKFQEQIDRLITIIENSNER